MFETAFEEDLELVHRKERVRVREKGEIRFVRYHFPGIGIGP